MKEGSRNIKPLEAYALCGGFCLILTLVSFVRACGLPEIHLMLLHKLLWQIILYIGLPLFLFFVIWVAVLKCHGLDIAYYTLLGCCDGAVFSKVISFFHPERKALSITVVILCTLAGHYIGRLMYLPGSLYRKEPSPSAKIFSGLFYGMTALSIAFVLIRDTEQASSFIVRNVPAPVLFAAAFMTYLTGARLISLSRRREKERLAGERDRIMKKQDQYDETISRIKKEKADNARREQEEKAENARREQEEKDGNARREQEKNAGSESGRKEQRSDSKQQSRSSSGSAGQQSYFSDCHTRAEIKRRYRKLCKRLHPDCPGGNKESFCRMQKEYEQMLKKFDK